MLRNHSKGLGALTLPALMLTWTLGTLAGCTGDTETPTPAESQTPVNSPVVTDTPDEPTPTHTPGTDTPGTDTPGTDTPGTDTPGTDTPTPSPSPSPASDLDNDGYSTADGDCNDDNGDINPAADEVCDGVDNNCDTLTDDPSATDAITYYLDQDGDEYGVTDSAIVRCQVPAGYTTVPGDCNDNQVTINPRADEICDSKDNDCDGTIDQDPVAGGQTYYPDADGDTFGDSQHPISLCAPPEGYVADSQDCDDSDENANPNGTEVPYNGVDDDCSGGDLNDMDMDGSPSCEAVADSCDCADTNDQIYPSHPELQNGIDDNCNGAIDEGGPSFDDDQDGYSETQGDCDDTRPDSNPAGSEGTTCDAVDQDCDGKPDDGLRCHDDDGDGYSEDTLDCNDADSTVNPGASEGPACDGVDTNCNNKVDDGLSCHDDDGDNYTEDQGDCNDSNPAVNPGATEATTCDGVDSDCSGQDLDVRCLDQDQDGVTGEAGDCNDNSAAVYPGATEVYDGLDNDCDELVDKGLVPEGSLVITEILNRPAVSDDFGEWFEVYNASLYPIDLYKWEFKDNNGKFTVGTHVVIQPKAYGSLGNCGDTATNGGYTHSYVYGACKSGGSFALTNSPSTSSPEKVEAYDAVGGRAIDKTAYTDAVSAKGVSRSLNPQNLNAVDNDATVLGAIWCEDKTPTFQAANDACAP